MKTLCYLVLLFSIPTAFGQQFFVRDSAVAFQKRLDSEYADKKQSPLTEQDRKKFNGLHYYPVDGKYFVLATLTRTQNEIPFAMPTTTSRKPMYVKYGELTFTLDGKACRLNVYQSIDLAKSVKYKNYLFLPFLDLTSGEESYGGGRYIDLAIPEGDIIAIDFNRAYNPYCAYNNKYSCPITPRENTLDVAIEAGVKKFHD
ncbi:MAG: hypothetical protein CFE23_15520 [Flavobacterium sp. BFFFF1]|uniref:DUF1684 domain-containing protein n=1 Tax=Flavobacterium sp. BFFFF1 TaxID=2015557 RepID=UPI000BC3A3EC|nr:DUF1684 domain-containing protein [Flavobacterium sp. BFFFF1]OYU79113.1 MAG: hypothetical protein CFE23_15520 [Flavobacterium sp. BFFFF1]